LERLSYPRVSADNRTVVVPGRGATVFARDPATSALTWAGCLDAPGSTTCGPVNGLLGAIGVAISPDGENVYINSGGIVGEPGAVVVLARNTATGILTFVRCIKNTASTLPCGRSVPAVDGHGDVAVAPRGDFVYTAAGDPGSSAIVWFARSPDTPPPVAPTVASSSVPVPSTAVADLPLACRPGVTEFCDGAVDVSVPVVVSAGAGRAAVRTRRVALRRFRARTRRGRTTIRVRLSRTGRRSFRNGRARVRVRLVRRNPNGTRTSTSRYVTLRVRRTP
jgi:hypothetical protein